MIEEMVVLLKAEQGDDDSQKAYCLENFDMTEDDAKALATTIAGHKDAILEFQEQLSNTDDRIAVVQQSLAELDDSVGKATEIRRNQHAEFNNAAATELLKLAVNRLNKFYALWLGGMPLTGAKRSTPWTNFTSSIFRRRD